ncbi:MAG: hypothetical protein GY950_09255, partial [bacterium]|nr:hypothetical protein [bacterium]
MKRINRFTTRNTLLSIILLIFFLAPFQTMGAETPNNCDLLNKTARLHFVKGEYGETAKYLDRALKINPNHLKSLLLAAELHLRNFEYNDPEKYLNNAPAPAPHNISLQPPHAPPAAKK